MMNNKETNKQDITHKENARKDKQIAKLIANKTAQNPEQCERCDDAIDTLCWMIFRGLGSERPSVHAVCTKCDEEHQASFEVYASCSEGITKVS